ncbi:Meckel syndrome type 1 protein-like [Salmo trutta]|uniref:Meckel syndrome type 1 protein-like n=1 Tax=Salmo trutta TaxID=8032 RepID=UPI001130F59E|nr:Meckel syndrome type 1 protein-like [Salmo trutta]
MLFSWWLDMDQNILVLFSAGDDEEELVVGWQEKLFSQSEAVYQTPLERQYHTEIMALERTRGRRNRRIFTYTDSDCYTNWEGLSQSMVRQVKSNPTFLPHRMANVRHRRQDRQPVDSTFPKSRLIYLGALGGLCEDQPRGQHTCKPGKELKNTLKSQDRHQKEAQEDLDAGSEDSEGCSELTQSGLENDFSTQEQL